MQILIKSWYLTKFLSVKRLICIIEYKDNKKVRLLCVMLPNMSAYRRDLDETKYMYFLIKKMMNCQKNIKFVWAKVRNTIKKDLIVNPFTVKSN